MESPETKKLVFEQSDLEQFGCLRSRTIVRSPQVCLAHPGKGFGNN